MATLFIVLAEAPIIPNQVHPSQLRVTPPAPTIHPFIPSLVIVTECRVLLIVSKVSVNPVKLIALHSLHVPL